MRIISGKLGGRVFQPPAKMPHTRPTTDLAKEGLFNILDNNLDFETLQTLDLFGGTGSISYELASRGVSDLTIVEKDPAMARFIKEMTQKFEVPAKVVQMDVFRYIAQTDCKYDFIFAGPPYALNTIDELPPRIFERTLLKEGGWFVLEHTPRNSYRSFPHFKVERAYGTTVFSIFVYQPQQL
jgi:16S rRNA (guanine966-N2)-methyltransferase